MRLSLRVRLSEDESRRGVMAGEKLKARLAGEAAGIEASRARDEDDTQFSLQVKMRGGGGMHVMCLCGWIGCEYGRDIAKEREEEHRVETHLLTDSLHIFWFC